MRTGVLAGGPIRGLARTMGASMARHFLGVLGVIAAGVLLAVSAAMNYRFGFSLGKTGMDGQIYGLASAAADCFKALVPFFLFAAIRNRMWSQAAAAAVVWTVVTGYSMTSSWTRPPRPPIWPPSRQPRRQPTGPASWRPTLPA